MAHGESFSYIQVDRSVLHGAERFLAQARHIGRRILGEDVRASVTETVFEDGQTEGDLQLVDRVVPITEPILTVDKEDDLRVVLLHRRAPKQIASRFAFTHNLNSFYTKIAPPAEIIAERGLRRYRKQTLNELLDAISTEHDQNPEEMPTWFDQIDIVSRTPEKLVFGLVPQSEGVAIDILRAQERMCELRLGQQDKKLAALPGGSDGLSIRFASAPAETPAEQVDLLLDSLRELPPVRLQLGAPEARAKDSRRS